MATIDEFSRLISGIYSAVTTPELWDGTMADIGHAFDGSRTALLISNGDSRMVKHADMPPGAAESYAEHYARLDHVLSSVENGPVGAVRGGAELMWPYENSEFHNDWARPNDFGDGLFLRLTDGPCATTLAVATSRRSERFDTAERVALMRRLIPHLQHALHTQRRLEDLDHRNNDLAAAGHAMRHGIAIVGQGGRVVYSNCAADRILRAPTGLRTRAGHIEAEKPRVNNHLQGGIARALSRDGTERCGSSVVCPRTSWQRALVIHVLPLDQTVFRSPGSQPRAMLVIVDPELTSEPPATLLRRLYGLTRSEAEVALLASRGNGVKPIADELCLSVTTVKTHLQHVFDKTGTHRQAELVRLLLKLDPVCRREPSNS